MQTLREQIGNLIEVRCFLCQFWIDKCKVSRTKQKIGCKYRSDKADQILNLVAEMVKEKENPFTSARTKWQETVLVRKQEYYDQAKATWEAAEKAGIDKGRREVVEWGNEICMKHAHLVDAWIKRRECDYCWQTKLKEWGIE